MNYSAKVSNKVERESNVLESNVRLNRNTGNREKRTGWTKHDETGNEADGGQGQANVAQRNRERNGTGETEKTEKRETGKRFGRGGNVGRTARDETGKRYGRDENIGRTPRDETGKRYGRTGNVGRTARDETGKRYGQGGNLGRTARDERGKRKITRWR